PPSGVRVRPLRVPAALDHRFRNRPHPPAAPTERRAPAGLVSTVTGDRLVHPLNLERAPTMKRLSLIVLSGIAAAALAACSHNPPPVTTPQQPNADSVAAAERARQDSIDRAAAEARAREEAERQRQQHIADSLAGLGRTTEAVRIETVSYGEERPIAQGHDEAAWAQNRRDEFEIIGGGDALKQP